VGAAVRPVFVERSELRRQPKLFPFLEGEARLRAARTTSYRICLFDAKGRYPKGRIACKDALYWADEHLVFMATLSEPWDQADGALPYTEMDWATPQELRLLGSILLCESEQSPPICFYPEYRFSMYLDVPILDLASQAIASRIKASVIERSKRPDMMAGEGAILRCLNGHFNLLKASEFDLSRHAELFSLISVTDHLFLRGIAALLKAEMLASYREFWEEAIVIAFIALEVSFQMVLRELRRNGIVDPTAADAAKWLHVTFDEPFGYRQMERYFEDIYDQRIMTLHPNSRFGICPYAPLLHDDYILLRRSLPGIFAYLVSGKHSSEYLAAVVRWGKSPTI
jgi:hypothetical protein